MKRLLPPLLCLLLLLCASCRHEDSLTQQFNAKAIALQTSGNISTVEYTVQKFVKVDDTRWNAFGERKILYSAVAYLKAGIPMEDFSMDDARIDEHNKSITLTLPHAKLISLNIPPERIRLEYKKSSGLRTEFSDKEKLYILAQGEKSIREDLDDYGILDDAERNARIMFTAILRNIGFENINIKFA